MDPPTYQSISAASQMDELGTTSPQPPGQVQQNQNSPTPHQQLNQSPMLLPPHQNSVSWQQHKQAPLTQPSDPALQRLSGLNRRTSLQPQQSQLRLNLQNSNYNDNSLARISSDSPDKPIFKNIWGFNENNSNSNTNNDKELLNNMSNERNNSNNSLNSSLTSLTFNSPNNPILNNLSTRTHRMSSINEGPTGIANNSVASPNMHTSFNLLNMSTNDSSHVVPSQQTPSMYNTGLSNFNPMRSKSFAISKSKFSMNLPTTYESDNYQQHQQQQQQQQQFHQQKPIQMQTQNQQPLQFSQIPAQKLPSQSPNPQSFQYSQQMQHQPLQLQQQPQQHLQNQGQQLYRRLSHQIDSSFNYQSPNMRQQLLESQQQQVIPPLRAEGPLLSSYNNQSNAFNQPRRESVAAVYHHQQQAQQFPPDHYQRNISDVSMLSDEDARYLRMQSQIHSEMATHAHDNFQDHNMQGYPDNSLHSHYSINTNEIINDMGAPSDNLHEANRVMHRPQSIPVLEPALDLQRLKNKRAPKFSKVSSLNDLHPKINNEPKYRRFSNNQEFISPLDSLTKDLCLSYSMCSSEFDYQKTKNPKRILTKNNKPVHNNGYDNENYDYILHVNDILGTEENKKYLVLDILGQGTFGQVVKCQNLKTKELVAVKVVKARQECLQQSIAEGNILEFLNKTVDAKSQKYFIQFKDKFMHKYHLCLVFELLRSNLYELIKQNQHHGLDIDLVRTFSIQILKGLCVLKDIKIIHCDLKPENILLRSLNKPDLKIIDFGSSCEEHQAVYTYVQSRFYRSPEVILGVQYSTSVDMWSFGCIVAELFLGLPLFPGATEFEQLVRIIQTFGMPPAWMMVERKASEYIVKTIANNNLNANGPKYNYRLKSLDEFNAEFHTNGQPPKKYFLDTNIDQIIMKYRLPRKQMSQEAIDEEMHKRSCLIHFLKGVLNISPLNRWTPHEAIHHPFITGEKWTGNWNPPTANYGSNTGDSNNTDHFNSQKNIPSSSQKMTRSSSLV